MSKVRGFEPVSDAHIQNATKQITEINNRMIAKEVDGYMTKAFVSEIQLPVRADERSAGYDFFSPIDLDLLPAQKFLLFTDVKAYMQPGEVLMLYPRSSMGIKKGLMLSNTVGVVDASYYSNPGNDGNIGLALLNTSGVVIKIRRGERIAQGIFMPYLVADVDNVIGESRKGGIGSSGK